MNEILENLNEEQKKAVLYTDTPLLVLAGAGSGKTRVITHKIMYLIKEKNIPLDRILAITFTNKASQEMKDRIKKALSLNDEPKWISTFHSLAVKILRYEAKNLKLSKNFVIYDEEDSQKVLKEVLTELNIDAEKQYIRRLKEIISDIKQQEDEFVLEIYKGKIKFIDEIFNLYQEKLRKSNALDFDDILLETVKLFEERDDIRKSWQERFDYILVDEYQDTNKIQHRLLKQLVGNRSCITVVGDPQQCIYTWRGAHPENILDFEKDFPDVKIIKLERNYRSTKKILDLANKIIEKSEGKWRKKVLKLWTDKIGKEDINVYKLANDRYEIKFIVKKIKEFIKEGFKPADISILIRMSYLSRGFEEELLKENISYQIVGGLKFYERAEIKDILAYLRFSINLEDSQAFKRIINLPSRGVGNKTIELIEKIKNENLTSWLEALKIVFPDLNSKQKVAIQEFLEIVEYIKDYGYKKPYDTVKYLLESINYTDYLKDKYPNDFFDRIQNINELQKHLYEIQEQGKTLQEFLEESVLSQAQDSIKDENSLKIMTIHASKGLEFPIVFLPALEEGIFPSGKSLGNPIELEEERRLFYVAITRAKEHLIMSFSENRTSYKGNLLKSEPSRFLKEVRNDIKLKKVSIKRKVDNKNAKSVKRKTFISNSTTEKTLKVGSLVNHKKYGKGVIKSLDKPLATVIFETVGEKRININFLEII